MKVKVTLARIYRCRNCDEEFLGELRAPHKVDSETIGTDEFITANPKVWHEHLSSRGLAMYSHVCRPEVYGVADVIGLREIKND